ncbi:MarR family winged helix-turn-helix transcriptional regulator [Limnohabitans sp. Jir72]|uniref:MarR family winged helix-turn-helix transcriptional regulator n=1 Tax=Limnohabitans sp. Jir72 TaxID=1977909 RepID=UPI000D37DB9E|nr:MarR family transcriptional regulator [Limnohabitans sp. Jir72]PUE35173.1 MarR family transcriptional regulator [Limnohabitans sp. Jir72]
MTTPPKPPSAGTPGAPLNRTLTYRLHQLHKLTDMDSQSVYPERTGLSMSDGRCLTTIGTFEPLSVKELADKANLNKGQASRAAQALVDQGLVRKADHPGDGRGVVLTLTPTGRKLFTRTMQLISQRNDEIFGCLTAKEQATLSAMFDRLIAHARPGVVTDAPQGAHSSIQHR